MPPKKKRNFKLPDKPPGLLEQYLQNSFSSAPVGVVDLLNGHVLLLFLQNKRSFPDTLKALSERYSITVSRKNLAALVKKTVNKYTHLRREVESNALSEICYKKFDPTLHTAPVSSTVSASVSSLLLQTGSSSLLAPAQQLPPESPSTSVSSIQLSPESPLTSTSSPLTNVPIPATIPKSPPSSTRHSSRKDPLTLREKKMRARLDYLSNSRRDIMQKYQNKLRRMREQLTKSVSRSQHNQAIRRKVDIISRLKKQQREHRCDDVEELRQELKKVREKHRRLKKARSLAPNLSSYRRNLEIVNEQARKLKEKDEIIRALQDEKLTLIDTVEDLKAQLTVTQGK